jgi:hypothetical protein
MGKKKRERKAREAAEKAAAEARAIDESRGAPPSNADVARAKGKCISMAMLLCVVCCVLCVVCCVLCVVCCVCVLECEGVRCRVPYLNSLTSSLWFVKHCLHELMLLLHLLVRENKQCLSRLALSESRQERQQLLQPVRVDSVNSRTDRVNCVCSLSLSLSLIHTHTHTHTHLQPPSTMLLRPLKPPVNILCGFPLKKSALMIPPWQTWTVCGLR